MHPKLTRRFAYAFLEGLLGEAKSRVVELSALLAGAGYVIWQSRFSWAKLLNSKSVSLAVCISVIAFLLLWHSFRSAYTVTKEIKKEDAAPLKQQRYYEVLSSSGSPIPLPAETSYSYPAIKLYGTATLLGVFAVGISWLAWSQVPGSDKPDLVVSVVNPASPGIVLFPIHANAFNVKSDPLLWDLDREDRSADSLFVNEAKYDWIRTDQHGGPTSLIHTQQLNTIVKPGHRVFGYITTACPDCETPRLNWVYFVYGEGGWYSNVDPGVSPDPAKIAGAIPEFERAKADEFLSWIPVFLRIPIRDLH